jgi:hypothetical protein
VKSKKQSKAKQADNTKQGEPSKKDGYKRP